MKEHKGVNVTKRSIKHDFRRANKFESQVRLLVTNCKVQRYNSSQLSQDTACQVDGTGLICTCRTKTKRHEKRYFSTVPEQVYAYHGVRSYTNIGMGNVKTIQRRKVRKIYLPEMDDRGVGSCDVSSVKIREHNHTADSYYVPKKTSSKCVGGLWQPVVNVLSEKLSTVVKCIYATTGMEVDPLNQQKVNIDIGNNTECKKFATTTTQVENEIKVKPVRRDRSNMKEQREIPNDENKMSPKIKVNLDRKRDFSSDFASMKSNNQSIVSSSKSLLRRRFEALRHGHKKQDAKKSEVATVSSSPARISHKDVVKDVSIVHDPPFLEVELNYNAKPTPADPPKYDSTSFKQPVADEEQNEFEQGFSGAHKHRDKYLEEDTKTAAKNTSDATKDKKYDKTLQDSKDAEKKTGGMKFSFFKKRSKDKDKSEKAYKTKKGVHANRCEAKPGGAIKTETNSTYNTLPPPKKAIVTDNHEDLQRKAWLRKFLTGNYNSSGSVKIRWNNNTYATSSSTVFTLVDSVYKQTGIVIRSKSDMQTKEKYYKSSLKKGNFVNQYIEAWMVRRTITDMPTFITMKRSAMTQMHDANTEVDISKKGSIDKANAFSQNMGRRLVLHSNTEQDDDDSSSDFLRIDIPNDSFLESCDEENRATSDEKVYNIVEYETMKSNSDIKYNSHLDTGDHADNNITVTVVDKNDSQDVQSSVLGTVIKMPPKQRDVVVQDGNVDFPTRCGVIGVGVLTQKDFKPTLKFQDDLSGDESARFNPKGHSEFAQSYLQEYYRQWMPLDMAQSSWCVSGSRVLCSCQRNSNITLNQVHGTKSCPNVYEDHPTTFLFPSHSSCSHCHNLFDDEYRNKILYGYVTSFKSGRSRENEAPSVDKPSESEVKKPETRDLRVVPKDSLEVFKKRQLYAFSNKSKWSCTDEWPCSVRSLTDQGTPDCPHVRRQKKSKGCRKKVCLVGQTEDIEDKRAHLEGIIVYKRSSGCECEKCKTYKPPKPCGPTKGPECESPPVCKDTCPALKEPPCNKVSESCPRGSSTALQCQIPQPDPPNQEKCHKIEKSPLDKSSKPCVQSCSTALQCQIPQPDSANQENDHKMKKPPLYKTSDQCVQSPSPVLNCEISPQDPAGQEYYEKINPPYDKSSDPRPPSPPYEPQSFSECHSGSTQSSDCNINCIVNQGSADFDTFKKASTKCRKEIPSPPMCDVCHQKHPSDESPSPIPQCEMCINESLSPSECSTLGSQFSEQSTNCMISFDESAGCNICKPPMKSAKPLKMPRQCDIASLTDPAYQKKGEKTKHQCDKCLKLYSESPSYESPSPSECNVSASQFSERSTSCMVNYEGSTGYETGKLPKPYKLGPHYDIVVLPRQKKPVEIKKAGKKGKSPKPPKPTRLSPRLSVNSMASQLSGCMVTYQGSTSYVKCKVPPPKSQKPKIEPLIPPKKKCPKSKQCPPTPLYGSPPSPSPSDCSQLSVCSSPPPRPRSPCTTEESTSFCKESCPEIRISFPSVDGSFCVNNYPRNDPLLGCLRWPPPKCKKHPEPCLQPPKCAKDAETDCSGNRKVSCKLPLNESCEKICPPSPHCPRTPKRCYVPPHPCNFPPSPCHSPPRPCKYPPHPCNSPPDPCNSPPRPCNSPPRPCKSPPPPCKYHPRPCKYPPHPCKSPPRPCNSLPSPCNSPPRPCNSPPRPCNSPPRPCNSPPRPCKSPPRSCKSRSRSRLCTHHPRSCKYPLRPCKSPLRPCNSPPIPCNSPPRPCNSPPLPCNSPPLSCNSPPLPCNSPPLPCNSPPLPCNSPPRPCHSHPHPCDSPPRPCNSHPSPCNSPPRPCNSPPQPCNSPPRPCKSPPRSCKSRSRLCTHHPRSCKYPLRPCKSPLRPCNSPPIPCNSPPRPCNSPSLPCNSPPRRCHSHPRPCDSPPRPCNYPSGPFHTPPRTCNFPPGPCERKPGVDQILCRPDSVPTRQKKGKRPFSMFDDPGPCRLCSEIEPWQERPPFSFPLCSPRPCPSRASAEEYGWTKLLKRKKIAIMPPGYEEDCSGKKAVYGRVPPPEKLCMDVCTNTTEIELYSPSIDNIGWIKLFQDMRHPKKQSFVQDCYRRRHDGGCTFSAKRAKRCQRTFVEESCPKGKRIHASTQSPWRKPTRPKCLKNNKLKCRNRNILGECPNRLSDFRKSVHRMLLGNVYKPNFCQRVLTKGAQIVNTQSQVSIQSLDNVVEIKFKMQMIQGDKIKEINLGNDGNSEVKNVQAIKSSCREDYIVNNTATSLQEQVASSNMTNGLNIHIVINNFKRKDKNQNVHAKTDHDEERSKLNEDFTNNICQTFHTVSTAYNNVNESDLNQTDAFLTQRATSDLTGSNEKSKTQPSGDVRNFTHKYITKLTTSQSITSVTASVNEFDPTTEDTSSWSQKVGATKSEGNKVTESEEIEIAKVIYNADETNISNHDASLDNIKPALRSREKKNTLKIVAEKAGKIKQKTKVSKLTKMFKAMMKTSESSKNVEMAVIDNDLTKHITLDSFKPKLFRNTGSMTNYYKLSSMTSDNEDCCDEQKTSRKDKDNKFSSGLVLYRTPAAKLNVLGQQRCTCNSPVKTCFNIETNCDIGTDADTSYVLSYNPSDYVDAATQRSRLFFSRANSANVSINNFTMKDSKVLRNIINVTETKEKKSETHLNHTKAFSFNISPVVNQIELDKECKIRKFNKKTISNLSDENKIIANMEPKREGKERGEIIAHLEPVRIRVETTEELAEEFSKEKPGKTVAPADMLQSYETKRAVLEIYTERMICDGRKHLVAKLPKFTLERESEIIKYQKICKRSFVMSFES